MFYQYEIINNGTEDVLYLYLTMKYEFANELSFDDEKDLGRRTKNFIKTNNINFKGKKVFLIVDGAVVKILDISKVSEYFSIDNNYSMDNFTINIKLDDNSNCEISLRDYLISVLLSIYTDNIHEEVLKAICVLFNGYAYKMMKENNYISANNSFAVYKPIVFYKQNLDSCDIIIDKINKIIDETDCLFLSYNNGFILPFMHYSNNNRTLTNKNYPYLSSVKSLWDMTSPYYIVVNEYTYEKLSKLLNIKINCNSKIDITNKNNIKKIIIDDNIYTLEEIKKLLSLKSNDIYIIINNKSLKIITRGCGNFYGLSIYGANEIALNGARYFNILIYYFPKTKLLQYTK